MRRVYILTTIGIFIVFGLLGAFVFDASYVRLYESVIDFGLSTAFLFVNLFGIDKAITPTVVNKTANIQKLETNVKKFFALFIDKDNFLAWLKHTGTVIGIVAVCVIAVWLLLRLLMRLVYSRNNTRHNRDTLPLRAFKHVSDKVYEPVRYFVTGYISFLQAHRWIYILWIIIAVFHLNGVTIVLETLAFLLYFVTTLDFTAIPIQLLKLLADLQTAVRIFPWWGLLIIAYILFDRWRRRIALQRLRHYEARNCGFINELPIVSIACGSMGKKKTTLITDMSLSQEVMFRQRALEIMQRADMKFPYFPWIMLERELLACMEYRTVYNLATVKQWIHKKRDRFYAHGDTVLQLYCYDVHKYGAEYDNGLYVTELFEVLETYALAYFIYVISSSLIVSNYAVRTSNVKSDMGNLPLWFTDFFVQRDITRSRHSHILDFDALRLGRKVIEDNPNIGSFEFGVVTISEIGKERGNNLELREIKRNDEEANQKNDLFNSWLKMCRHSATVDNYPFIKVFTDEQRPESWGADARDLCDIIRIVSSSEQCITLPFYTIQDMLSEWLFNRFIATYTDFRYRRGDNTLFIYLYKKLVAWVWNRNVRNYNRYGYCVLGIEKERGTMDGKADKKKYYLMNAKIYAKRFSTDCFSDYFNDLASHSNVGLDDYFEYQTERASVAELQSQNSYFINSLYGR